MAVGGEKVEPSVEVVVEEDDTERQQMPARGTDAPGDGFVGENKGVLFGDIQRCHLVREVANGDSEAVVVLKSGGVDAHRTADFSIVIEGRASHFTDLFEG